MSSCLLQTSSFTPAAVAERYSSRACGAWSRCVARHALSILSVVFLAVCAVLVLQLTGPLRVSVVDDPDNIWLTAQDFGNVNRILHDNEWGRDRPEWIVLTAKTAGANLASKEALQELFMVEDTVFGVEVDGMTLLANLTFTLGPGGPPFMLGLTCMWGFNPYALRQDPAPLHTAAQLAPFNPAAKECGPASMQPQMVVSGMTVSNGSVTHIDAFKLWYYLDDSNARRALRPGWTELLEEWERSFEAALDELDNSGRLKHLRITRKALASLPNELAHELTHDVSVYVSAVVAMLLILLLLRLKALCCGQRSQRNDHKQDGSAVGTSHVAAVFYALTHISLVLVQLIALWAALALVQGTPHSVFTPFSALLLFPLLVLSNHHVLQFLAAFETQLQVPKAEAERQSVQGLTPAAGQSVYYQSIGESVGAAGVRSLLSSQPQEVVELHSDGEVAASDGGAFVERIHQTVEGRWGTGMWLSLLAFIVGMCLVETSSVLESLGGSDYDNYTDSAPPGIRSMARFVLYAVVLEHFLLLTVGVACLSLWPRYLQRQQQQDDLRNRSYSEELTPPLSTGQQHHLDRQHDSNDDGLAADVLPCRVFQPVFRLVLSDQSVCIGRLLGLLLLVVSFGCGIWGATRLHEWHQDLQLWDLFSSSSRLYDYYRADYTYFREVGLPLEVNMRSGIDYSSPAVGTTLLKLSQALSANPYVVKVPFSWYDAFIFTSVFATSAEYHIPLVDGAFPPPANFTFFFSKWVTQPNSTFQQFFAGSFSQLPAPFGPPVHCPGEQPWYVCTFTRFQGATVPLTTEQQQRDAVESIQHIVQSYTLADGEPLGTAFFPPWSAYRAYSTVFHSTVRAVKIALIVVCTAAVLLMSPVGGVLSGCLALAVAGGLIGVVMSFMSYGIDMLSTSVLFLLPFVAFDLSAFPLLGTTHGNKGGAIRFAPVPLAVSYSMDATVTAVLVGLVGAVILTAFGLSPITYVTGKLFACSLLLIGVGATGCSLLAATAYDTDGKQ